MNIHRIPDRAVAEREASEWIARLQADDVSDEDRRRFEAWRGSHGQNARAYEALSATWHELKDAGSLVRAVSFGRAMDANTWPEAGTHGRKPWKLVAVAASIAIIAFVGTLYWRQLKAETLFQTAIGEHASVALPDGSTLELNSNSLARVDYNKAQRVVHLERGEAFFKVQHEAARPFWVVAGRSWVRALGTAFNVYVRPNSVQITVSEGVVKVSAEQSDRTTPTDRELDRASAPVLKAGEQADVRSNASVIRALAPAQLRQAVSWREGTLYFENQPLGEVVDELRRYTPLQIDIRDESLRQLPVGGTFKADADGAEALLTMLRDGLGLSVEHDGDARVIIDNSAHAQPQ